MRPILPTLIILISSARAFMPTRNRLPSTPLLMSTSETNYAITGNNLELTPSLRDYVNTKLDKVIGKLSNSGLIECSVNLIVNKNKKVKNSHKAEVVTALKGTVIRCAEESPDMYASIDFVTDRLARKLRKYKERRLDGYHGGPNMGENLADVLDSLDANTDLEEPDIDAVEDEFVDPEAPVITKVKSYDLSNPVSIQEAVFALDYVDHDFFVFRDEDTNEINVVYKRNAGGYGLIQPQK